MADTIRLGAERMIGLLNDAAGSLNEPSRVAAAGSDAVKAARAFVDYIPGNDRQASPLLAERSRNRRFVALHGSLDALKAAARSRELTLNDVFVGAVGHAMARYHLDEAVETEAFTATAIISTRSNGDGDRGNAFVPVTLTVPGTDATLDEQAQAVGHQIRARREQLGDQPDVLAVVGSMAGLVPSALMAHVAVEQASRVDFATSNLPGPPIPLWFAGTKVKKLIPMGPVAGTACNATMLSYDRAIGIGIHLDPVAITDPDRLVDALIAVFGDLGVLLAR